MNSLLLGIVGIIYIFVGINYFIQGNFGLGIAFISYSFANLGLWIAGG